MPVVLQIGVLLLLVLGLLLLLAAYRLRQVARPTGHVDHADAEVEAYVPHGPLISLRHRLAGQPHGLLRLLESREVVPVYVIEAPAPASPSHSTRLKIGAFCLLTELVYDQSVPYGLVRYADEDIPINYTPGLSQLLEDHLTAMAIAAGSRSVDRSHDDPTVCRACPVQADCDQALAQGD